MISFKDGLLEIVSFTPYPFQENSAWISHLPFAAWLIRSLEPKVFVELGSHWGHSYFSFCQSVREASLATKCYAVDTWQGDEHSFQYGEEVFHQVNAHNQAHYANFSRLLRMTFDDAASYFSDDSIDLLHIDGLHTYGAVKHDFETWLPKLAPGAVVLFHDTNVRERDFGVWKLWEELQVRYPNNLELLHSHGLGVLQLDGATDAKKLAWLNPNAIEQQQLKDYFSALGARHLERFELGQTKTIVTNLNQAVAERDGQITNLNQAVAERDGQITNLNQAVAERDGQISSLNQAVADRDNMINALFSSTSWRLTKNLRWCGSQVIRAKLLFRALSLANTHTGDAKITLIKLIEIYKREGLHGVRSRIRFLLERNAYQNLTHDASALNASVQVLTRRKKEVVRHHQSVDVIVCVHNALDDVRRCLESIMCNTYPPYHVIIVDDGSGQETKEYLEKFIIGQPATLIRNDVATGYTKAANSGMRASKSDFVVLLNSDTIVPPRWLDRLIECANSSEQIGIVGPLSNTASWQSVPLIMNESGDWADNPLPRGWSANDYANEVARVSQRIYPRVGFLNGFCLLIKRKLIEDVGLFDEVTFARGYGEENDYCLRATERNWQLAVADDCYVFHAQSKSYSHERRAELARLAGDALANKHGQDRISRNLSITQPHPALHYMRQRCSEIEKNYSLRAEAQRHFEGKRVLFLLPAGSAGGGGNIVLLEVAHMRMLGVDAWVGNLETHRPLFERSHPEIQVPVLYLQTPAELLKVAPGFDAVVATLYLTVFWMEPLRKIDGCPNLGYYIQDFEPDFFDEGSADYQIALSSYTAIADLRLFTKTNWNQHALHDKLGVSASVIGPSLDIDRFHPSSIIRTQVGVVKILAMVRPSTPRRAAEVTMRVLERLAHQFGEHIQITIFGVNSGNSEFLTYSNDFSHSNLGEIDSDSMAAALSDADIFVDCSIFQAMGLTAMEAMASGVAVVGPISGGLKEIIVDGHNGILVDTQDEDSIFAAVSQLISDAGLRARIQRNALDVLKHSPVYSTCKILDCLFPKTI